MMNLFPVPIELAKLKQIDNDRLVDLAYSLKNKNDGRIVSNKGGFQSNNLNFNDITDLMIPILSHISAYCGKLNLKKNTTINVVMSLSGLIVMLPSVVVVSLV